MHTGDLLNPNSSITMQASVPECIQVIFRKVQDSEPLPLSQAKAFLTCACIKLIPIPLNPTSFTLQVGPCVVSGFRLQVSILGFGFGLGVRVQIRGFRGQGLTLNLTLTNPLNPTSLILQVSHCIELCKSKFTQANFQSNCGCVKLIPIPLTLTKLNTAGGSLYCVVRFPNYLGQVSYELRKRAQPLLIYINNSYTSRVMVLQELNLPF